MANDTVVHGSRHHRHAKIASFGVVSGCEFGGTLHSISGLELRWENRGHLEAEVARFRSKNVKIPAQTQQVLTQARPHSFYFCLPYLRFPMGIKRPHEAMEDQNSQAPQSPFMPMFESFRAELDEHHDRRERIIKASRDITAASKKM